MSCAAKTEKFGVSCGGSLIFILQNITSSPTRARYVNMVLRIASTPTLKCGNREEEAYWEARRQMAPGVKGGLALD